MRNLFFAGLAVVAAANVAFAFVAPLLLLNLVVTLPLAVLGLFDALQTKQAVRRNFPILGNFRYGFELIRPEINQYFVESDVDGKPFNRETRSVIYQRAKGVTQTLPFGTRRDVSETGYEWFNHSIAPVHVDPSTLRIKIGGPKCTQPYSASVYNISAMSYGSLSKNAVLALNGGAKSGGFAHNTGEGGISPYHLEPGGDLVWQVGTGYFGCRNADGSFSDDKYRENAQRPSVKMIELKLSQGAKPGHGGILPAAKVTEEISKIRGVPMGQDVLSPPGHGAFSTPEGLCAFIGRLRELSGGKPVGFKLCVGKRREVLAIMKAIEKTGIAPDFITVDGGEGGTGAAPLEFSNHLGTPMHDGLILVHNALTGFGLRDDVKIIAASRVTTANALLKACALGADATYAARAMMFALGCIQALRCNTNNCPVGVATQDPELVVGLHPGDKAIRTANFHKHTVHAVAEMLGAMGLKHTDDLQPWHLMRRVGPTDVRHYGDLYAFLSSGALKSTTPPPAWARALASSSAESFAPSTAP